MLSYVLLISIVLSISIGVYAWMKSMANVEPPVDCPEDSSIALVEYWCDIEGPERGINLRIKNNGRFNISGVMTAIGNDSKLPPVYYPRQRGSTGVIPEGIAFFPFPLQPGAEVVVEYSDFVKINGNWETFNSEAKVINIQPFIIYKKTRVLCSNTLIKENFIGCDLTQV